MSGTPAPAEDPHGSKTSPIMVGGIILSAIAVICLLFFVFSPSSSENDSSSGNKPSNGNVGNEQPVSNIIHVEFSGSFGKVYNIPSGRICNYLNATKPYIMRNRDGSLFPSNGTEDISDEIGIVSANKSQQFCSQDGSSGSLDIILTKNNN